MIGLPEGIPIYLCTDPVDFRKGFDGLTGIVTASLGCSVTDGSLFLFVNRKRDRIKALWWETGGLTLWYRRLEQGTVEIPKPQAGQSHVMIDSVELAMWIAGVSLKSAKKRRKRMKVA
ncbi:MAG: IS66 family insertion sequence element accessory protein TnpB [Planctomycetaceae bacterium]|nr:IS66 family insertion sequence element accessory protein TnpB [Planctomycetaceae bacterium]